MEQEELHSKEWNAERLKALRDTAAKILKKHNRNPEPWTDEQVSTCISKSTKGRIKKSKKKKKK